MVAGEASGGGELRGETKGAAWSARGGDVASGEEVASGDEVANGDDVARAAADDTDDTAAQ